MTATVEGVKSAQAESERFDRISIILHWLTVLLIVGQFSSAGLRKAIDENSRFAASVLMAHWNSGMLIWLIALARLVWRRNFAHFPLFPETMSTRRRTIATAHEYALYALLLVQPITGLGRVLSRGEPFELWTWDVPAVFAPNDTVRHAFAAAHGFGAAALLALVGLHAGSVLFHQLVLRDGALRRMSPWTAPQVQMGEVKTRLDGSGAE